MHDLIIDRGDHCVLATDSDGFPAIRIQNAAFVEEPRWLGCYVTGPDRSRYINELIDALVQLRDAAPADS